MSQYCSRLHIRVTSPEVWRRFVDADDASFDLARLADSGDKVFTYDADWSCVEDEIFGIVSALAETIGEDGLIIADTTNINVDPFNYCVFYFGDSVETEEFSM